MQQVQPNEQVDLEMAMSASIEMARSRADAEAAEEAKVTEAIKVSLDELMRWALMSSRKLSPCEHISACTLSSLRKLSNCFQLSSLRSYF